MLEKLVSSFLLKPAAAEYAERARYYRERAGIESVRQGIRDHDSGNVVGVKLVDITETETVMAQGLDGVEFAIGRDGLAFARVEDGMLYPITLNSGVAHRLKVAQWNESLSRSFIDRFMLKGYEGFNRKAYEHAVQSDSDSDAIRDDIRVIRGNIERLKQIIG